MPMLTVRLGYFSIVTQDIGGDDAHIYSRAVGQMDLDGKCWDFSTVLKQTAEPDAPIEIGPPNGYRGPFNQAAFANVLRARYQQRMGNAGVGGKPGARLRAGYVRDNYAFTIEVSDGSGEAW